MPPPPPATLAEVQAKLSQSDEIATITNFVKVQRGESNETLNKTVSVEDVKAAAQALSDLADEYCYDSTTDRTGEVVSNETLAVAAELKNTAINVGAALTANQIPDAPPITICAPAFCINGEKRSQLDGTPFEVSMAAAVNTDEGASRRLQVRWPARPHDHVHVDPTRGPWPLACHPLIFCRLSWIQLRRT